MVLRKKSKNNIKEDLEELNSTEGWNLVLQVTRGKIEAKKFKKMLDIDKQS